MTVSHKTDVVWGRTHSTAELKAVKQPLEYVNRPPSSEDIRRLFDRIAPTYDDINQQLSLGLHRIWKQMAVDWSAASVGQTCLDICCGSGDVAILLAKRVGKNGQVYGLDFSAAQLAIAQHKKPISNRLGKLHWVHGDALALPFDPNSFDAVTMAYGLRNLTSFAEGLQEIYRILRPGAKAAILDFGHPDRMHVQQFQKLYLDTIVVPAARRFGLSKEYAYINSSLERFPTGNQQKHLAREVGFTSTVYYPLMGGLMGVLVLTQ